MLHDKHMAFNEALKLAIFRSGKTQIAVAKEAGMDDGVLSKVVRGYREATPEQRKRLAKVLRRKVHELFPDAEEVAS